VRALTSLATILVACVCVTGVAYGGGPGAVYNDYAADGKLSCNHSRADLLAVLRSGSLNQYGDPYTLAGLKLAVRRQLAGGCRGGSASSGSASSTTGGRSNGTGATSTQAGKSGVRRTGSGTPSPRNPTGSPSPTQASAGISNGGNGAFVSERVLVAGLLAGGLAIGGWLTRRALTRRS
jgi:hypothetical protein